MNIINPKLLYMVLNVVVWGFVVENDSDQKYSGVCVCFELLFLADCHLK